MDTDCCNHMYNWIAYRYRFSIRIKMDADKERRTNGVN
jgi:hypothetical protein